jgi:hypothetical protein
MFHSVLEASSRGNVMPSLEGESAMVGSACLVRVRWFCRTTVPMCAYSLFGSGVSCTPESANPARRLGLAVPDRCLVTDSVTHAVWAHLMLRAHLLSG